ncbi:uncharacterized protein LOC134226881 [Armigeres subalbatus]|uniref:uncharacterized protein LOC134226881 n=1 Tax=Armigeres subalbatus TaxID=124917 RepID=UPI002ED5BC9C
MSTLPQFILEAIEKAAEKCGYSGKGLDIQVEPCNKQDGFIGQLFRATLKRKGLPDKSLICKIPPLCAARREQFDTSLMFEREPWFYSRILPEFERYQREKGIGEQDGFTAYAKSYVAHYESMEHGTVLVLEDLISRGFRMAHKLVPLDYDHIKLAMVQLGRFHALSFAMKRDQPKLYQSLKVPNAILGMFRKNEYCRFLVSESLKLALEIPGLNDNERKLLIQLKDNVLQELERCLDVSEEEHFTAIIHSDFWINNCMFSYDEDNLRPKELILIDWQLGCCAVPAVELVYLFYLCTDGDFRRKHFVEMIDLYHQSLGDLLKKLGGNAEVDYPYEALQKHLKQVGRYGVMMGSFLVPAMCIASEDLPNLDESAARQVSSDQYELPYKLDETSLPVYQKRMLEVIRDAVQYGCFDV